MSMCTAWETVELAGQCPHFLGASELSPHPDTHGWQPEVEEQSKMTVTAGASKAAQDTHEHVDWWTCSLFVRIMALW